MPDQPKRAIPRAVPDVRVRSTRLTPARERSIKVESTRTTTSCRNGGKTISSFYGYDRPMRLRHLPSVGLVVSIEIRPKRSRCPFCADHPTTTQRLRWYAPRALPTKAYEPDMRLPLVNSTMVAGGHTADLTPDAREGISNRWRFTEVDWHQVTSLSVVGIDEIARTKGHGDASAVRTARRDNGAGEPLAVVPDRTKATVRAWLATLPAALRRLRTRGITNVRAASRNVNIRRT